MERQLLIYNQNVDTQKQFESFAAAHLHNLGIQLIFLKYLSDANTISIWSERTTFIAKKQNLTNSYICVCVFGAYTHGSCGLSIINWFFWSSKSGENEKRNLNSWNNKYLHAAAAAAHTTIRHYIYSTSPEKRLAAAGQDKTTYSSAHKIHICFFFLFLIFLRIPFRVSYEKRLREKKIAQRPFLYRRLPHIQHTIFFLLLVSFY